MEEPVSTAYQILTHWWASSNTGIKIRGATAAEIADLERRYDVSLPDSFRAYLSNASTASDESMDNELTTWWSISMLRNVSDEYEHPIAAGIAPYRDKLICFADYSLWCSAWAINCFPGRDYGKIAIIGDNERFVADSFDDFVERYVRDANSVM